LGREDEIRLIAYSIWEEQECPVGRDREDWFKAEAIWEEQNKKANGVSSDTEFKSTAKQKAKGRSDKKNSR
jgi:Protein of unknown function (DUF2934)